MLLADKKRMSKREFVRFINEIDLDFPIPLSDKTDIIDYCEKLWDKSTIIIDVERDKVRGVLAGYIRNLANRSAYVSLVGVSAQYRGQGIGRRLVREFIEICSAQEDVQSVNLYTHKTNLAAIKMYETLGFERYKVDNESRTEDIHFIKYL